MIWLGNSLCDQHLISRYNIITSTGCTDLSPGRLKNLNGFLWRKLLPLFPINISHKKSVHFSSLCSNFLTLSHLDNSVHPQ